MNKQVNRRAVALQLAGQAAAQPARGGAGRVTLNAGEKLLLDEALEQCRQAADEVQDRVVTLGVWLLRHLFHGDARAALGDGTAADDASAKTAAPAAPAAPKASGKAGKADAQGNLVWAELVRRAGGPTLRLSPKMLSVALRSAAWDRLIPDESWRGLDVGRKELLLPLAAPDLLREGAQHVVAMRLTQRATRQYVQTTLQSRHGKKAESRLTPRQVAGALKKTRLRLVDTVAKRRIRQFRMKYDATERKQLVTEVDALIAALRAMKKELGGGR